MASANRHNEPDRGDHATRLVFDIREHVFAARRIVFEHAARGHVPTAAKRELAVAILEYWDALKEHSDEKVLQYEDADGNTHTDWHDELDQLPDLLEETVQVRTEAAGARGYATAEQPAINAMHWRELIDLSKDLDRCAKDLEFTAPTPDELPVDKI
jgi:hypothetical protein